MLFSLEHKPISSRFLPSEAVEHLVDSASNSCESSLNLILWAHWAGIFYIHSEKFSIERVACHNCYIPTWVWILILPVTGPVLESCHVCVLGNSVVPSGKHVCISKWYLLGGISHLGSSGLTWAHLCCLSPQGQWVLPYLLACTSCYDLTEFSQCSQELLERHFISISPTFSIRPGSIKTNK